MGRYPGAGRGGSGGRAATGEQLGQSLYAGGTSLPHFGQTQLNIDSSTDYDTSMDIVRRARKPQGRLAVLCGAFNPPTRAHLALAEAAAPSTGEVFFVLPRRLPHKDFSGAAFDQRLEMLLAAASRDPRFSVGVSESGLLWEIAREFRADCGAEDIAFLLGRDAAERILSWHDPKLPPIEEQLRDFRLMVAARGGAFTPPAELASRIQPLVIPAEFDSQSATEVRRRAAAGEPWEALVPEPVVDIARRVYAAR